MPALASCSSPSSFQLRWGLRCRKSPPIAQSIRFGASNRSSRIKIVRADAGNVDAEDGNEGPASQSLNSDASQVDKFAGWFGEDYEGGGSEGENRSGGIAGAALAGIFLAGGLAFASLSLTSRRQNGFKPEMQTLTAEQEVLLTSESEDNKILVEERSTEETMKGIGSGSTTGTNEDYSILESIESTSHSRVDITPEVASSGREHELVSDVEASHDKDTLVYEDSDMSSTISDPNYIKNELPIPEPDVASSFTDSHFQIPCDNINSTVQGGEEKSESRGDYSSLLYGEPLDSEKSVLPKPNLSLETQHNHESIGLDFNPEELDIGVGKRIQTLVDGSVTSSLEGGTSQSYPSGTVDASSSVRDDKYEILNDTVIFAPEGTSVNESGPPLAPSVSVFAGHYINEPGFYPQDFINRSLTSPSVLPETHFSHAGIPAPSVVSPALQVQPGKVLIPALVDQAHGQALAALQTLKVIEADVQPGDLCTRREYARWLVSASSILSRSTTSKVYPAMYIENVSELAFDDITPEDPDFPYIQGLAEAGLISSRLSQLDNMNSSKDELAPVYFSAESPLSRQDLVSWKMALEKTVLPEVDRKAFHGRSGYVDIDKINPDAWPAIAADLSSGENGIISLAFGFTRLFQPNKPVTKAQAAVALSTGAAAEIVGEELARIEAESLAETAVLEHAELVAEVEKDLNASFERELTMEREKIEAMEKLIREARLELEKLRSEREEENNALMKERASVESEMEILSRLRNDVELQLESLLSNKTEIAFERDRINKLHEEAERENLAIARLQYELEVERKALAMARAWAEDEAKRAREQAKILEEARGRWEKHGIKVVVDEELRESASAGVTWQTAVESVTVEEVDTEPEMGQKFRSRYQHLAEGVKARADQLVSQLKELLAKVKGKSAAVIESLIQKIMAVVSALKHRVSKAKTHAIETKQHVAHQFTEVKDNAVSKATTSMHKFADNASEFGSSVRDGTRRAAEDFRESVEKITQRFKM